MDRTVNYVFKASVGMVPKPSATETGMSQKSIGMLKQHKFPNKAFVLETGASVTVTRKGNTQFLLIPFKKGEAPVGTSPSSIKRGYNLIKGPVTFAPGARVQGSFGAFWSAFWEDQGQIMIEELLSSQIEEDFFPWMKKKSFGIIKPVRRGSVELEVAKYRKETTALAHRQAKARKHTEAVK